MAVVEEEEVVEVVVVSFVFKSSSLLSFDVLFVAFGSSPSCGDRIDDVAVVVVVVVVADDPLVDVVCLLPPLASSCCFFFGTGLFVAAVAAFLNFLHSLRCPPFFQWFT